MSLRTLTCVILTTALSSLSCAAHAQTLQRGVVIDADRAQALVMLPEGGIDAIDLGDGSRRWHSRSADMPLALSEGSVVALAGPAKRGLIHYAFLDGASGAEQGSHYATLPTPARALVDERLGERFEIKADAGLLRWDYSHEAVTGALLANDQGPSPDGVEPKSTSPESTGVSLSGTLRIDAANAKLVAAKSDGAAAKTVPAEIGLAQAGQPRRFRSVDDAHVLVSHELEEGRYRWSIEDRQGKRLGGFESGWSYLPFMVADGAVLFVRPLGVRFEQGEPQIDFPALIAMDLGGGTARWEKEIRDTAFRGPYPP